MRTSLLYLVLFMISCVGDQTNYLSEDHTKFKGLSSDEKSFILNEIENGYSEVTQSELAVIENDFIDGSNISLSYLQRKGKLEKKCQIKDLSLLKRLVIKTDLSRYYKIEDKNVSELAKQILNLNEKRVIASQLKDYFRSVVDQRINDRKSLESLRNLMEDFKSEISKIEELLSKDLESLESSIDDILTQIEEESVDKKSLTELELELSTIWRELPDESQNLKGIVRTLTIVVGKHSLEKDKELEKLENLKLAIDSEEIKDLSNIKFLMIKTSDDNDYILPLSIDDILIPESHDSLKEMSEIYLELSKVCS